MAKEILLYGYIWEYNALYFHDQIREFQEEDPEATFLLRVNTEGGEPAYMQSIITKVQALADSFEGVVGEAQMHSAGFFLMCYIPKEKISCINTTNGVLHRASYSSWYEKSEGFKGSINESVLISANKELEKALRARVDVDALEALPQMKEKGFTLKDIFALDAYNEVLLSASDMKKIGLIGKIIQVTPKRQTEITALAAAFKDTRNFRDIKEFKLAASTTIDEPKNNDIMDLAELKAKYPAIYAQAKAEGHTEGLTAGIAQEKDRVEAILVFNEIDPTTVKAAIEGGKPLSQKQLMELQLKAFSKSTLGAVAGDSAKDIKTDAPKTEADEKTKQLTAFKDDVYTQMGIKKKDEAKVA